MADLFVWTLDDLLRRSEHPDDAVRAWAIARLGRTRSPAAFKALLRALRDPFVGVVLEALRAIHTHGHRFDLTPALDDLRAIALGTRAMPPSITRLAETLLLRADDEAAIVRVLDACLAPDADPAEPVLALVEAAPARVLTRIEASGMLVGDASPPDGTLVLLPRIAPRALLPALYQKVNKIDDRSVAEALLHAMLLRAGSEHLCDVGNERLDELLAWLTGRAETASDDDRDAVTRWLSTAAFDEARGALQAQQWAKAIAWSEAWVAALAHPDDRDDDAAQWGVGLLKLLRAERSPRGFHAFAAVCLAVAASERALERAHPFATCDFMGQVVRTAYSSDASWFARAVTVSMRWASPRRHALAEAAVQRAAEALTRAPPFVHAGFLRLAARLPGLTLAPSVLDAVEREPEIAGPELRRYLEAQPQALRLLAPVSLDAREGRAQLEVLQSLAVPNAVWVAEILGPRLEALVRSDYPELVLSALESLGDVSLLPRLIALWRPGAEHIGRTVVHLARIDGSIGALPPALLAEEEARRTRQMAAQAASPDPVRKAIAEVGVAGAPRLIELRCNRCRRRGRYAPGAASVHPDPATIRREGWDGVTFAKIVVCKHCGAEDDYTLSSNALLGIVRETLQHRLAALRGAAEAEPAAPVRVGQPRLSDGTLIRRASDALRHWQKRTERNPSDAEAWLQLGLVCVANDRVEPAIAALRRTMALRPKHMEAPGALLTLLARHNRLTEGLDLPQVILDALPHSHGPQAARNQVARQVAVLLQTLVERGVRYGLRAAWRGADGTVQRGTVDLKRITRWPRVQDFFAHSGLVEAVVYVDPHDPHDPALGALLNGDEPFEAAPAAGRAPVVHSAPKPGRNDPCHCGSGKKYKKCHGA